jgi:hypothetical protein
MQLEDVSKQIDELIIGNPANKSKFIEHIEKVIRELEKYRQYLLKQWQRAKKEGWLCYDESKEEQYEIYQLEQMAEGKTDEYRKSLLEGWRWRNLEPAKEGEPDPKPDLNKPVPKPFPWTWMLNAYSKISQQTYFTINELYRRSENKIPTSAQFYIKGKPKPDPINYLYSMVWGSRGQDYKGLELLDYQFTLLAIIHDAQSWQAGRERIYFSFVPHTQTTTLADRFCEAIYEHLCSHSGADVLDTIEIALLAVKEKLRASEQKKDAGTNEDKNNSLLQKFEQDVQVVVEHLDKCAEIINQLYTFKNGRRTGLPGACWNAHKALNFHLTVSSPPEPQLQRMLKWLVRDLPNVKVELENQYYDIVRDSVAITKISDALALGEQLSSLELKIRKLSEDLSYYIKMAKEAALASTKQNANSDATPKTDASLIYQADASTFYNIPKSVLSKAAQKQPGESGYLWSGHDGKRVFYKKSDIEKINRSRTKLKS